MEAVFLKVVNMSLTAGWLVLAVIALRLILKNAPKYLRVILWGFVGIRLVLPFSLESVFSLIPSSEPLPEEFLYAATPQVNTGIPVLNDAINPIVAQSLTPITAATSANPTQIWSFVFSRVWVLGMVLMICYALISYLILRRKVAASIKAGNQLRFCDHIESPFILGILSPIIYIPSDMDQQTVGLVLAHEYAHLKRKDHWWKPLGFILLSVYWFNPLLWVAYVLLCRDIELACDEKVIAQLEPAERKAYSSALLQCSISRRMIAACPLAFGEVDVKDRIKTVLNYKKPAFWLILIGIVICIIVAVCFLTDPIVKIDPLTLENWGITITAQDPTPLGVTLAIDIPDNLDGKITIPSNQTLLQLENGQWVNVPPIVKESDVVWDFIEIIYPDYKATYQRVEWERYYGRLEPGEYRISKTLWLHKDGLGYQKDFYVEFQIAPDSMIETADLSELIASLTDKPSLSFSLNQENEVISGISPWGCLNDIQTARYLQFLSFEPILYPDFQTSDNEIRMKFTDRENGPQLLFYEGSNDLILSHNESQTYYRASYEYADLPVGTIMRNWFDEAMLYHARQQVLSSPVEPGKDSLSAAEAFCNRYFDTHTVSPTGSMYRYSFVTCQVEIAEEATQVARTRGELGPEDCAFWVTVIFVPDNDRALRQSMPGNTHEYTGSDPNVPDGAWEYTCCGYLRLTDDGWTGEIVGTLW